MVGVVFAGRILSVPRGFWWGRMDAIRRLFLCVDSGGARMRALNDCFRWTDFIRPSRAFWWGRMDAIRRLFFMRGFW